MADALSSRFAPECQGCPQEHEGCEGREDHCPYLPPLIKEVNEEEDGVATWAIEPPDRWPGERRVPN